MPWQMQPVPACNGPASACRRCATVATLTRRCFCTSAFLSLPVFVPWPGFWQRQSCRSAAILQDLSVLMCSAEPTLEFLTI